MGSHSFSRGFSWPRGWTWVSCIASRFFTVWVTWEALTAINYSFLTAPQSPDNWFDCLQGFAFPRKSCSQSHTVCRLFRLASFSESYTFKFAGLSCSVMSNSLRPHGRTHQASLSMGILQARIPEWVVMLSSRGSSWPGNQTGVSCIAGGFFTNWATLLHVISRLDSSLCVFNNIPLSGYTSSLTHAMTLILLRCCVTWVAEGTVWNVWAGTSHQTNEETSWLSTTSWCLVGGRVIVVTGTVTFIVWLIRIYLSVVRNNLKKNPVASGDDGEEKKWKTPKDMTVDSNHSHWWTVGCLLCAWVFDSTLLLKSIQFQMGSNYVLWMLTGILGLPWWPKGKESAGNARDVGLIPGSGRFPAEGNGYPHSSILAWRIPWTEEPGGHFGAS